MALFVEPLYNRSKEVLNTIVYLPDESEIKGGN